MGSDGGDPVLPKRRRAPPKSEAPSYDAQQLLHSLGLNGSPAELRRSMSKLRSSTRQQGVLQHAAAVVAHLRDFGLEQRLLEELFVRCPELFSWPPEEQAEGPFSELMSSGLTAAEAAHCFIAYTAAARFISFRGSIAVVDEILSHSQDSNRGVKPKVPAAERTAAAMLRADPSSVQIIHLDATKLRRQCDRLVTLGCSSAAVAKLLWYLPSLLCSNPNSVAQLEQAADVLHDELGLAPEAVLELVATQAPSWTNSSSDTLRRRAAALAEVGAPQLAAARETILFVRQPLCWKQHQCTNSSSSFLTPAGVWQRRGCQHCGTQCKGTQLRHQRVAVQLSLHGGLRRWRCTGCFVEDSQFAALQSCSFRLCGSAPAAAAVHWAVSSAAVSAACTPPYTTSSRATGVAAAVCGAPAVIA
jgi:hypothetical protein